MKFTSRLGAWCTILGLQAAAACTAFTAPDELRANFSNPPADARPWVYWMWMSSNLSREGLTADLEAMQRVGLGGTLIMDVDDGTPHGPMQFMDAQWQAMFRHTVSEAKRLGLEINMNNGAGYYGSGGTWVKPEQGMQWVFASETHVSGGQTWRGVLPKGQDTADYRDIGVVAVAERAVAPKDRYQIPDFMMKSLTWKTFVKYRGTQSAPLDATAPADDIIPLDRVIDLSGKMAADGTLEWTVPAGEWTILRLGHAYNGSEIGPAAVGERGPETDKLSRAATDMHFDAMVKRLNQVVGPEAAGTLVTTHIDSWEGGGQNWTAAMREEFKRRRGYDPLPYLPILTRRILGDLQISERFLWDLRKTVSELMVENYAARFQQLAHQNNLRFSFESYTTTGNDLDAANYSDEPMAEFWTPIGNRADFNPTMKSMSSAAHLNGKRIVGAETMTASDLERWLWHPARLKVLADDAFSQGINRFVFHRYAAQRFTDRLPGIQMGPWGLHYERTNTWWEWTGPWHAYLTRCQYLLRQGEFVADVLSLESEEPIRRFQTTPLKGYDYDACGVDTIMQVTVKDGRVTLPNGRQYRLLVLNHTGTMTVKLLAHLKQLVEAGAVILGNPPQATPGLTNFPQADGELQKLAAQLWGNDPAVTDRVVGQGRVFRGLTTEAALAKMQVTPDFTADIPLHWIHRHTGEAEIYFVANPTEQPVQTTATFRVAGKSPERWDPLTGQTTPLATYSAGADGVTPVSLALGPTDSAFIVFRTKDESSHRLTTLSRDGQVVLRDGLAPAGPLPIDLATGEFGAPGRYVFTQGDGQTRTVDIAPAAKPVEVKGPWSLHFPPGWGTPEKTQLNELVSWSEHSDRGIKYFSGTATYTKTLSIPANLLGADSRLYLDLGKVAVMARVTLNGHDLGILWRPPYRVDIGAAAKAGDNALEIAVVNLWPNRLIGDEQLDEDSERNKNGTLKSWPEWLLKGHPSPTGRFTFSSWRLWKKDEPLQESGLLGPVSLQAVPILPREIR